MTRGTAAALADPVDARPSLTGPHGRAWAIDLDAAAAVRGHRREDGASVCALVVEAAWAHPFWHSYILTLASLKDMPSLPPPVIHLPGATHELLLAALDPGHPRGPTISGGTVHTLLPLNFAAQFQAAHDAAAMERTEAAVRAVCEGRLSPDSDHRHSWAALFGNNMLAG